MKFLENGTQEGKLFLSTLKRGRRANNGTMFQNLDYHGSSDAILASKTPVSQSLELIAAIFLLAGTSFCHRSIFGLKFLGFQALFLPQTMKYKSLSHVKCSISKNGRRETEPGTIS